MDNVIHFFFNIFKTLGLFGVFLSMFIENIGIPLPTEIGYLLAQQLINSSRYSYGFVLFVLTSGHVIGSIVSYQIGRWGDNFVVGRMKKNKKITEVHEKLENWYVRYGNITILITRFVGYVRPWSSFLAGFAKVDFRTFLLWTILGSLVFNIMCLYFTSVFMLIWRNYESCHFVIAFLMFLMFFAFVIFELIKNFCKPNNKRTRG